jgi:hypothetical protein
MIEIEESQLAIRKSITDALITLLLERKVDHDPTNRKVTPSQQ